MLKWGFSVSGQSLTRTDELITNADLVGQLQAEFTLDSWWDDYIVIAQFVRDGVPELRILQDGICDVPDRVLKGAGIVYISLYAVGFETRKTTNEIYIEVEPSGIRQGSLSPDEPSGDVWQQTLEMLNGLKGGLKGQILRKFSDDDYASEWANITDEDITVDDETLQEVLTDVKSDISVLNTSVSNVTSDNTYIFDVAELKSKSLLTITRSAMTETGDEAYPYAVEYEQRLRYGNTNQATGEFTSNINTDLGIKYYKRAQWEPTALGGNLDVLYVGDNVETGYPHRLQEVMTQVGVTGGTATSNVKLLQLGNIQYIRISTIVKFPTNPTETNITDIENYLNGEANSRGRYIKKMYIRIEVPKTKEVSVL